MQGIRVAEFKILLDYLNSLKEMGSFGLSKEQQDLITEKEKELRSIYANYQFSLQQVSENIRRFENEKQSIRRFLKQSKQLLKGNK